MQRLARLVIWVLAWGTGACASSTSAPPVGRPRAASTPVEFIYHLPTGESLSARQLRGRVTVIAMVTTYDLGSQILLRRLQEVVRTFQPRINAVAVVLEPPRYRVLLETFRESLNLSFPVVLADSATLRGRSPFGPFDHVPHLVFLDRRGRQVARLDGPVTVAKLDEVLRQAAGA